MSKKYGKKKYKEQLKREEFKQLKNEYPQKCLEDHSRHSSDEIIRTGHVSYNEIEDPVLKFYSFPEYGSDYNVRKCSVCGKEYVETIRF